MAPSLPRDRRAARGRAVLSLRRCRGFSLRPGVRRDAVRCGRDMPPGADRSPPRARSAGPRPGVTMRRPTLRRVCRSRRRGAGRVRQAVRRSLSRAASSRERSATRRGARPCGECPGAACGALRQRRRCGASAPGAAHPRRGAVTRPRPARRRSRCRRGIRAGAPSRLRADRLAPSRVPCARHR